MKNPVDDLLTYVHTQGLAVADEWKDKIEKFYKKSQL